MAKIRKLTEEELDPKTQLKIVMNEIKRYGIMCTLKQLNKGK